MPFAKRIGIDVTSDFLFRSTTSDDAVIDKPLSSSASDARLKLYSSEAGLDGSVTVHGFRSGCAITFALSGTDLQHIMGHVGWHYRSTAS